ncbi:MAG: hypothetical protein HQL20_04895 [Candidatus Omnitrophica bacterium]|nr:hypothetical protein [Candidatus Omnitrophota bacterium]
MGKKNNSKQKDPVEVKKTLLSDRQKKIFLIVILAMFILIPIVDNLRCKAACLKRVKTPYPEIACKYQCPWPWARNGK